MDGWWYKDGIRLPLMKLSTGSRLPIWQVDGLIDPRDLERGDTNASQLYTGLVARFGRLVVSPMQPTVEEYGAPSKRGTSTNLFQFGSRRSVRKRGLRGDLAVRRVRGTGGVKSKQDRILRSLGLYSAGQISLGFVDEPTFIGQIVKVPHHVAIIPLTARAYAYLQQNKTLVQSSFDALRPQSGRIMSRQMYEVIDSAMKGEIVTLEDGEFIQCEQGVDCFSLLWSSATPFETTYARAAAIIGERDRLKTGFVCFEDGEVVEGTPGNIENALRRTKSKVELLRVDGDKFAFAWTASVGRLEGEKLELNECSIVCRDMDLPFLGKFVKESSTVHLGSQALDLVNKFAPLMEQVTKSAVTGD